MKALRVDFASRRPVTVWPWLAVILTLGVFMAYQARLGWDQQGHLRALRLHHASLSEKIEMVERTLREANDKREVRPIYLADAVAIANVAAFPLNRALASLESAQVLGVKITGLEATPTEGTVRIDVEFANHVSLLSYLEAINGGEPKPRWVLVQAQASAGSAAGNSATLISSWVGNER